MDVILSNNRPIVDSEGRPTIDFSLQIREFSRVATAVADLSGVTGTQDDIARGLINKVRAIAQEEIARNTDGEITSIVERDTAGAVLVTRTITYVDGAISTITIVDDVNTILYTYSYDADGEILNVVPTVVA